tara:strand:- start:8284 stop:9159 length:876 start_codon:yes stop_codon:yes gene_type:complete
MNLNDYPLWTAVITPMKEDGSVDFESYGLLLKEQEAAGNGVLTLGSTGEALNIDESERREVLSFTLKQKLKVPVMVGVGGVNLRETLEWVNFLNTQPIQAILLVTPLYAKPGDEGQYEWFKTLLDATKFPAMLYNVPSRTGKPMSVKATARLKDHKNLWAIKEASGSVEEFKKYREAAPNARIYSGDDAMTPKFCPLGGKGLVSVAANVWPAQTHEYVKQCLAGTLKDEQLWADCSNSLFAASNPIPAKVLLKHLGRIASHTLRAPLTHKELPDCSAQIDADQKINQWFKK